MKMINEISIYINLILNSYDLLSVSSKLCVFDTSLLVKKALAALIQHGRIFRNKFLSNIIVKFIIKIHKNCYNYEN